MVPKMHKKYIYLILFFLTIGLLAFVFRKANSHHVEEVSAQAQNTDWQQLQHDSERTGRTSATVGNRLRARWIWMGPNWILRNKDSKQNVSTWDDDLASREGYTLPMPTSVPFTFAESMQPLILGDKVFVGDHTLNKVWALRLDDGETIWEKDNPGGTAMPGVVTDSVVVFGSLLGYVTAWDINTGDQLWQIDTSRSITSAPLLHNNTIFIANLGGEVYAISLSGQVLWKKQTEAPIQGGLAASNNKIFVENDAMFVYAFDAATGTQLAKSPRLMGQSFRGLWPVIAGNRVILRTVPVIAIGSEYYLNGVIDGTDGNFQAEQTKLRTWLQSDAGKHFEHYIALDINDLSKDYIIPNGPVGGVGFPADPPVVLADGKPVTWWPTYFGTITRCSFGCPSGMEIDLVSFDLNSGTGIQLTGSGSTVTGIETDNTFGMTVGGNTVYLRQNFRGTKSIDLTNLNSSAISAEYRWRDGGGWIAPLNYAQGNSAYPVPPGTILTPLTNPMLSYVHMGPAITQNRLLFTERFGVTCMESY